MQHDQPTSNAAWTRLEPHGSRQRFKRNAVIYAADQPARSLFVLVSGQVSLQMTSPDGRTLTIQVVEPGELFGHMALLEDGQYDTSAEATRPSEIIAIGQGHVHRLMLAQPDLALALLRQMGEYRATISQRLDEVAFKPVPARLASLLLNMTDSASPAPVHLPRRTHQQLAEMINAYRETVTKVINQFRAARLLDMDRSGITLLNISRLREISDNSAF